MNVRELIDILDRYPKDFPVYCMINYTIGEPKFVTIEHCPISNISTDSEIVEICCISNLSPQL